MTLRHFFEALNVAQDALNKRVVLRQVRHDITYDADSKVRDDDSRMPRDDDATRRRSVDARLDTSAARPGIWQISNFRILLLATENQL